MTPEEQKEFDDLKYERDMLKKLWGNITGKMQEYCQKNKIGRPGQDLADALIEKIEQLKNQ